VRVSFKLISWSMAYVSAAHAGVAVGLLLVLLVIVLQWLSASEEEKEEGVFGGFRESFDEVHIFIRIPTENSLSNPCRSPCSTRVYSGERHGPARFQRLEAGGQPQGRRPQRRPGAARTRQGGVDLNRTRLQLLPLIS